MGFQKGISGNMEGRPLGAKNKITLELREKITDFLENNFAKVVNDFEILTPKERTKLYCDLLQYGIPKLQAIQIETEFERLTDQQLQAIIDGLVNRNNESERKNTVT